MNLKIWGSLLAKRNFLALVLKISYISLYFRNTPSPLPSGNRDPKGFLYFRKCNFLSSSPKKFLVFPEMEPCTFQPKFEKIKKSTSRKFLTLQETETLKKLPIFLVINFLSPVFEKISDISWGNLQSLKLRYIFSKKVSIFKFLH